VIDDESLSTHPAIVRHGERERTGDP